MSDKIEKTTPGSLSKRLQDRASEAELEKAFVAFAESKGCHALKLRIDGQNGFPDRTVLTPQGVFFLEFKAPGGKLRPAQEEWIARLRKLGFYVAVIDTLAMAEWTLNTVLKGNEK